MRIYNKVYLADRYQLVPDEFLYEILDPVANSYIHYVNPLTNIRYAHHKSNNENASL